MNKLMISALVAAFVTVGQLAAVTDTYTLINFTPFHMDIRIKAKGQKRENDPVVRLKPGEQKTQVANKQSQGFEITVYGPTGFSGGFPVSKEINEGAKSIMVIANPHMATVGDKGHYQAPNSYDVLYVLDATTPQSVGEINVAR